MHKEDHELCYRLYQGRAVEVAEAVAMPGRQPAANSGTDTFKPFVGRIGNRTTFSLLSARRFGEPGRARYSALRA